ncbi:MAG: Dam family site-specific DNA-(adenine-N6)-methyltransferase [Oscillospiraceae bacterium]|jgi:DNA adenine methylase|nr:Dam family site-specific DNA-(adenine-N6)-methyltransferase [Oscillospiraceae bacterium]
MTRTGFIKSPLNYTGGKYKLLPDIFPAFIPNARRFVDLFAGGFNVGINADAEEIFCNDQITYLIGLFRYFRKTSLDEIMGTIYSRISEFRLSDTNEEGYKQLRIAYNQSPKPLDLFVLTCYSFNHQIRFNSKHQFNTPFGKERSAYNDSIERNVYLFCSMLKEKNVFFSTSDFSDFDFSDFDNRDFVYCDPPYLISTGSYNDGKRGFKDWTEREERVLLDLLDRLDKKGIRFALSNVFYHKGNANDLLINWSERYRVMFLDKSYSNCSYHFKDRDSKTVEVLITNYEGGTKACQQMSLF